MKRGLASSSVKFVGALLISLNLAAFTAAAELKAINLPQDNKFTFGRVFEPSVGFTLNKVGRLEIKQTISLNVTDYNATPNYTPYNKWMQNSKWVPAMEGFKLERAYVKRLNPEILNFNKIVYIALACEVDNRFNNNFAFVKTITDGKMSKAVFDTFARNQQLNRYELDFYKFVQV